MVFLASKGVNGMVKVVLMFCTVAFFSVDAMDQMCYRKALNRRARNYAEIVSEGKIIDKESLIKSLQFLPEDALKDPMVAILADEAIFSNVCKQASAVSNLSGFAETCRAVFAEADYLKKVQVSMLLEAVFCLIPRQDTFSANGLEKLISSSAHYSLGPVD